MTFVLVMFVQLCTLKHRKCNGNVEGTFGMSSVSTSFSCDCSSCLATSTPSSAGQVAENVL